jgi:hypothetical protein
MTIESYYEIHNTKHNKSSVVMIGNSNHCFYTLKKILESECKVIGVIVCVRSSWRLRLKKEIKDIKKYGFLSRLSQIIASILHTFLSGRSDKLYSKNLYDDRLLEEILFDLKLRSVEILYTSDYESDESLNFLKLYKPDFLISHTPYWISKRIRGISSDKVTIGSHPGYVPDYRGAHSSFWCIYDNQPEMNGYSIFCLDSGIDSGPIIKQEKVSYDRNISYRSNDLLLMKVASSKHSEIAANYSKNGSLEHFDQNGIDPCQIRRAPSLYNYCKFLFKVRNS